MDIQTERLSFRRYRDGDFRFLQSLLANPEVVRFIGNGNTRNRDEALEFLYWIYRSYQETPDIGLRLMVREGDNQRIGHAGLVSQLVDGAEELEIGYWIAPEFWGQGYAKEAAAGIRDYAIGELGKKRMVSLIQPGNEASKKVAQYVGMSLEKEIAMGGKDVCVYALEIE
jgi:RimJ/RimL family protein N-acetyltransferase